MDEQRVPGDRAQWTEPGGATAVAERPRRGRRLAAGGVAVALALGGGAVVVHDRFGAPATAAAAGTDGFAGSGVSYWPGQAYGGTTTTGTTRDATDAEEAGVVNIDTVLDYGQGAAAGTGIVLSADGEILTNNHVVSGATSIRVTIVGTGAAYTATVVGTDATDDVAVLQLANASGLTTATLGSSAGLEVGDAVTAVGNAGGDGGGATAATGTVTGLDRTITAADETGTNAETLDGMIEVDADIEAGDSGGPLYADGAVVGIDTAASSDRSAQTQGYAIPIATALAIADRIEAGEDSATIEQGYPAFLGVELAQGSATIAGVVEGSAADEAGLTAGDTITAVDGSTVDTAADLSAALDTHDPGDTVRLTWTDTTGTPRTTTATLTQGPVG